MLLWVSVLQGDEKPWWSPKAPLPSSECDLQKASTWFCKCKAWDSFPTRCLRVSVCACVCVCLKVAMCMPVTLVLCTELSFCGFLNKINILPLGLWFPCAVHDSDWSSGLPWGKFYGSPEILVYVSMYNNVIHYSSNYSDLCLIGCQMEERGVSACPGFSDFERSLCQALCHGSDSLWVCSGWARPWERSVWCHGRSPPPRSRWKVSSVLRLYGLVPLHSRFLQKLIVTHSAHSRLPQPQE